MISKSKSILSAMALIAAIGAASPALALTAHHPARSAATTHVFHSPRARSGLRAFGMVPRPGLRAFDAVPQNGYGFSNAPSNTGGGSAGFNWAAEHDS